jgi:hypothetical protein
MIKTVSAGETIEHMYSDSEVRILLTVHTCP